MFLEIGYDGVLVYKRNAMDQNLHGLVIHEEQTSIYMTEIFAFSHHNLLFKNYLLSVNITYFLKIIFERTPINPCHADPARFKAIRRQIRFVNTHTHRHTQTPHVFSSN